jgi:glycosyltransferase involved in cell wall biosynthesis
MVHQGSELYGSDRSFLSSLKVLYKFYKATDIVLPQEGELGTEVEKYSEEVLYRSNGYLRKVHLLSKPLKTIFGIFTEFLFYRKKIREYDFIYINTIVCISAIVACSFNHKIRKCVHVREIPNGFQLFIFKLILRLSGCELIYNSHATKKAFGLHGVVVLNGVFEVKKATVKERLRFDKKRRLLVVGRINSWKGQDFLLKSLGNLKDKFEVRIVGGVFEGQDYYLDELKEIVEKRKLDVSFFNFCSDPSEHYHWAHFVVVPSKLPEPFGRVAVEAMSAYKPVLAAEHGGLTEIVDDGLNGFFFKPNNKYDLQNVLQTCSELNEDDYYSMAENSHKKFEMEFSEVVYQKNLLLAMSIEEELND